MRLIGKLRATELNSVARLSGQIQTFDATLNVRIEGDELLCDAQKPSHRIHARNRAGSEIEIGAAWLKTIKRGERTGQHMLTLSIDYPGLSAPLNAAAFPSGNDGEWIVSWERRSGRSASATA